MRFILSIILLRLHLYSLFCSSPQDNATTAIIIILCECEGEKRRKGKEIELTRHSECEQYDCMCLYIMSDVILCQYFSSSSSTIPLFSHLSFMLKWTHTWSNKQYLHFYWIISVKIHSILDAVSLITCSVRLGFKEKSLIEEKKFRFETVWFVN